MSKEVSSFRFIDINYVREITREHATVPLSMAVGQELNKILDVIVTASLNGLNEITIAFPLSVQTKTTLRFDGFIVVENTANLTHAISWPEVR